jgi:hypothetical protein
MLLSRSIATTKRLAEAPRHGKARGGVDFPREAMALALKEMG